MIKNEDGSILVLGLFMLVLLTLTGFSVSRTSSIEVQIVGNDRIYKQNFYLAEASVIENAQRLEYGGDELINMADPDCPVWLIDLSSLPFPNDMTDPSNWTAGYTQTSVDSDTLYFTLYEGIQTGTSLDVSRSRVYSYRVFGRSNQDNGLAAVQIGYRRAF